MVTKPVFVGVATAPSSIALQQNEHYFVLTHSNAMLRKQTLHACCGCIIHRPCCCNEIRPACISNCSKWTCGDLRLATMPASLVYMKSFECTLSNICNNSMALWTLWRAWLCHLLYYISMNPSQTFSIIRAQPVLPTPIPNYQQIWHSQWIIFETLKGRGEKSMTKFIWIRMLLLMRRIQMNRQCFNDNGWIY